MVKFTITIALTILIALLVFLPNNGLGNGNIVKGPSGYIPKESTEIEWFSPAFGPMDITKFKIDETGFRQWVKDWEKRDKNIIVIINGEVSVYSYDVGIGSVNRREIKSGLFSSYQIEDRSLILAYDKESGTAFYNYISR